MRNGCLYTYKHSKIILKGIILIINLNQYIIGIFVYFGTGNNLIATLIENIVFWIIIFPL